MPKKKAPAPTKTSDLLQALRESAGIGSPRKPKRAAAKAEADANPPKTKRRTAHSKRAA